MLVIFQNVIGLHASRGCIISKIFVFEMDLAIRNVKQLNNNRSRRRKRKTNKSMTRLASTVDGLAFLKCAFAAPDFESDSAAGVPDEYSGRTLTKKHRYISTFTGGTTDTFFLLLPTPGVAYWTAIAPAGTFPGANIYGLRCITLIRRPCFQQVKKPWLLRSLDTFQIVLNLCVLLTPLLGLDP